MLIDVLRHVSAVLRHVFLGSRALCPQRPLACAWGLPLGTRGTRIYFITIFIWSLDFFRIKHYKYLKRNPFQKVFEEKNLGNINSSMNLFILGSIILNEDRLIPRYGDWVPGCVTLLDFAVSYHLLSSVLHALHPSQFFLLRLFPLEFTQ